LNRSAQSIQQKFLINVWLLQMRDHLMEPRPDWNRLGPYVPRWFRDRMSEIDPDLTLQFWPPQPRMPAGFWSICLKLPHTRLLWKKSVMDLYDPMTGRYTPPDARHLKMLRYARNLSMRDGTEEMIRQTDRDLAEATKAKHFACKDRLGDAIERSLSRRGITWRHFGKTVVPAA